MFTHGRRNRPSRLSTPRIGTAGVTKYQAKTPELSTRVHRTRLDRDQVQTRPQRRQQGLLVVELEVQQEMEP